MKREHMKKLHMNMWVHCKYGAKAEWSTAVEDLWYT
jgi:hypothetical protein